MVMDPNNPRIIYAGMWQAERKPWTLIDGEEKGGVWKTTDGSDTWKRLSQGLPDGIVSRVGIAVSPVNPSRVWVIQESQDEKKGGIYLSEDSGKDFERIRTPHGDNHCLWINPQNANIMIQSNDGGANVSFNGGRSWSSQMNQPTSEIYRVAVDNQFPYRVYGDQQDNSSISISSQGRPSQDFYTVGGGESGQDPINYQVKLDNQLAYVYSAVHSQDSLPIQAIYDRYDELSQQLMKAASAFKALAESDIKDFEKLYGTAAFIFFVNGLISKLFESEGVDGIGSGCFDGMKIDSEDSNDRR